VTATATEAATIIEAHDLGKTYGTGETAVHALRNANVEIRRGELVVILGPSGSGKTTLLNMIGGIDTPTSGTITVDSRSLNDLDDRGRTEFRRDVVGFVFQFFNLVPTLTAEENVRLIAELTGHGDRDAARKAIEAVGLGGKGARFPSQLSGGEQQRVAIARAIAKDPSLLLCDEPTGALDLETGQEVLAVLQRLNEQGRTVVMVTHNAAIAGMADLVLRVRSGEIVETIRNERPIDAQEVSW
jgi:putative ABC transport system ATP-binding protein